jgi:hypothetical protein
MFPEKQAKISVAYTSPTNKNPAPVKARCAWHNVSREHLPKYVNEFEFRWNTRKLTDGARMAAAIPMVEGKRLFYRRPE